MVRLTLPEMWCVSRKGTPLRTRYSERSVASMKEERAAFIRSGLGVSVASTWLGLGLGLGLDPQG